MSKRGISPVIGVVLLAGIVLLLVVVAGYAVVGVSENALGTAAVHSQSNYDVQIENELDKQLVMELRGHQDLDPDTEFILSINDKEVRKWQGKGDDEIHIQCLYPGDEVELISANGDTTVLLEDFQVQRPTSCTKYNTFEKKFPNAVVDGNSHQVRDDYNFGLSINPNGTGNAAAPGNGTRHIGKVSLQNPWHHVEVYEDKSIEGLEPPVFVIVMVDNVHYGDIPKPSNHESVDPDKYYNWTDDPPSGLDPGEDAFNITTNSSGVNKVIPRDSNDDEYEPTNDVYIVFQPGCEQSTVKFVNESAGFDNEIYKDGELVIPNTNDATEGQTFSAPGTGCPNGGEWR